jgi:hypothetical protein
VLNSAGAGLRGSVPVSPESMSEGSVLDTDTAGSVNYRGSVDRQENGMGAPAGGSIDFTEVPGRLDANFDKFGGGCALRAAIITPSSEWTRTSKPSLLSNAVEKRLGDKDIKSERDSTLQLLDALTRSGAIPISNAEVHVIVAATHSFANTLMDTVVVDNINPIDKVEQGMLIAASTVFG